MKTVANSLTLFMIGVFITIARADTPLIYIGVVHKGSRGTIVVFPDVCKTPTPSGPIPIPYPNLTTASDFSQGTRKTKAGGKVRIMKTTIRIPKGNQEAYELTLFNKTDRAMALRQSQLIELEDNTYCAICMKKGRILSILKLRRAPPSR